MSSPALSGHAPHPTRNGKDSPPRKFPISQTAVPYLVLNFMGFTALPACEMKTSLSAGTDGTPTSGYYKAFLP